MRATGTDFGSSSRPSPQTPSNTVQRTAWMVLTGHKIDAGLALKWGLVDKVL